jgi:hypothetical protein
MTPERVEERIGSIVGAMVCVGFVALIVFGPLVAALCSSIAGAVTWVFGLNFFRELDNAT